MLETYIKTLKEVQRRLGGDVPASGGGGGDVNDDDDGGGDPAGPSLLNDVNVNDDDGNDDDDDDDDDDYYDYYDDYGGDYAEGGGVILELESYSDGGFGGVPASREAIATKLKGHKYTMHEGNENDDSGVGAGAGEETAAPAGCAICVEDFQAGDDAAVMPCSHMFHNGYILKWLSLSRLCPYCRHALELDVAEQQNSDSINCI